MSKMTLITMTAQQALDILIAARDSRLPLGDDTLQAGVAELAHLALLQLGCAYAELSIPTQEIYKAHWRAWLSRTANEGWHVAGFAGDWASGDLRALCYRLPV